MDICDATGSEHKEGEEKKLSIQINEYFAVAYDTKHDDQGWYSRRVIDFSEENCVHITTVA